MTTVVRGRQGEAIAAAYYELLGFQVRRRNLRIGPREIDLVLTKNRLVVFAEVKLRSSRASGGALAALDFRKRFELLEATSRLHAKLHAQGRRVRYDLVAIQLDRERGLELRHYPAVFSPPSSFVT
jgi:putative endonuclease